MPESQGPQYKRWRMGHRDEVRRHDAERFRRESEEKRRTRNKDSWMLHDDDEEETSDESDSGGGGGLLGSLAGAGRAVGDGLLSALEAYEGAVDKGIRHLPAWAVQETGQALGLRDPLPVSLSGDDDFAENQAYVDAFRQTLPGWARFAFDVGSDPLTYLGPGALKGIGRVAAGKYGGRAGAAAGSVLEGVGGPKQTAGFIAGGSGGVAVVDQFDIPKVPEGIERFLGGAAGGIAGAAAAGRRGLREVAREDPPDSEEVGDLLRQAHEGFEVNVDTGEMVTPRRDGFLLGRQQNMLFSPERYEKHILDEEGNWIRRFREGAARFSEKTPEPVRSVLRRLEPDDAEVVVAGKQLDRLTADIEYHVKMTSDLMTARFRNMGLEIKPFKPKMMPAMLPGWERNLTPEWVLVKDGKVVSTPQGRPLDANDVIELPPGARNMDELRAARAGLGEEAEELLTDFDYVHFLANQHVERLTGKAVPQAAVEGAFTGRKVLEFPPDKVKDATKGFQKLGGQTQLQRVFSSAREGIEAGYSFANPIHAMEISLRAKYFEARDAFVGKKLQELGRPIEPEDTVGGIADHHTALGDTYFPPKVEAQIRKVLKPRDPNRVTRVMKAINSVLVPVRATLDGSGFMLNSMYMILRDPVAAVQVGMKATWSLAQDGVYDRALMDFDDAFRQLGSSLMEQSGLRYVGSGIEDEFLLGQGVLNRLQNAGPIGRIVAAPITISNKHYERTLNLMRIQGSLQQLQMFQNAGLTGNDLAMAQRLGNEALNVMFGASNRRPKDWESAALFAPRYFTAAIETQYKAFEGLINELRPRRTADARRQWKVEGHQARMARNHLLRLFGFGVLTANVINSARGYDTEWDPRNPNFMRLRNVGGQDISVFGTYNTLWRATASLIGGEPEEWGGGGGMKARLEALHRFLWGKSSPALSMIYEPLIQHSTYDGKRLDIVGDPLTVMVENLRNSLPFSMQAMLEGGYEGGIVGATGLAASPITPTEGLGFARDNVAQRLFGKDYRQLDELQQSQVERDEGVAEARVARAESLLGDRAPSTAGDALAHYRQQVAYLGQELEAGVISGNEYRRHKTMLGERLRGSMGARTGGDPVLNGWYALYDKAVTPSGRRDWELLEKLQGEYMAQHPGLEEALDSVEGLRDPVSLEYRAAQKVWSRYQSIPPYMGMSLSMGRTASAVNRVATDMVTYGQAPSMEQAYAILMRRNPRAVMLARMARDFGPNPLRAEFRRRHRSLAKFYSDVAFDF